MSLALLVQAENMRRVWVVDQVEAQRLVKCGSSLSVRPQAHPVERARRVAHEGLYELVADASAAPYVRHVEMAQTCASGIVGKKGQC